jgi:phosphatidylglycerophosphatase A
LFDIVKVWPADYFDVHSKNGWGVMLDDVFAGIWAGIVVVMLGLALY